MVVNVEGLMDKVSIIVWKGTVDGCGRLYVGGGEHRC